MADLLVDSYIFINHLRGSRVIRPRRHRVHDSAVEQSASPTDALISATALVHRLGLLTRNRRDFARVRGLRFVGLG